MDDPDSYDANCTRSAYNSYVTLLVVLFCLYGTWGLVGLVTSMAFSYFSTIDSDKLTLDNVNWITKLFGTACKHGPGLMRLLFFLTSVAILSSYFWVYFGSDCYPNIALTHSCITLQDQCPYNQLKNCM